MTGAGSGGGGGYDYVESFFPGDAEEGESLYQLDENAAFVYTGSEWVEQTVTDHSQLSGVNEGDHRSDQCVSDLAPVQSVNGRTGDVAGLFEASAYTPESDTHDRYTDAEASSAAPVQSVNGRMGDVTGLLEASAYTPESDTHSRYTDGEARTAVDGSNVSVGYADNAGELGGKPPSHFNAITSKDAAVTFTESDVNVSGSLLAGNGSLRLYDGQVVTIEDFSQSFAYSDDSFEFDSVKWGTLVDEDNMFNIESGISGSSLHKKNTSFGNAEVSRKTEVPLDKFQYDLRILRASYGSGYAGQYVEFRSGNTQIAQISTNDSPQNWHVNGTDTGQGYNLDQNYTIGVKFDWGSENVTLKVNGSTVHTESFQNGANGVDTVEFGLSAYNEGEYYIDTLREHLPTDTSGTATVEWPDPGSVHEWDKASFQPIYDGESVDVYIEESTNGGSTWNQIQGPISRVEDINADPGSRIRFHVEISRNSTSNNPQLNAIHRRWRV